MASTPAKDPLTETWQHLADAEIEHDADHARRAIAALAKLQQRQSAEEASRERIT